MCGIALEFSTQQLDLDRAQDLVNRRLEYMKTRGPDARGVNCIDGRIVLGHNRLAIIDLEPESNQPFALHERFSIVFNGEIYNYCELRADLISQGASFRTSSDTEVILQGFAFHGIKFFNDLRGMFAFIIYDRKDGSITVARDSFGMKPLYFSRERDTWSFSSSLRALAKTCRIGLKKDPLSEILFTWFGFTVEPKTIYKGIEMFAAGHVMQVCGSKVDIRQLSVSIPNIYSDALLSSNGPESAVAKDSEIESAFINTVRLHCVADVEVGLFLSSGLDSNLIASAVRAAQQEVLPLTLAFSEFENTTFDETVLARVLSDHYGFNHRVIKADFEETFDIRAGLGQIMDQPSIDGQNVFMLSNAAKSLGLKVSLMGTGADELFAGYSLFKQIPRVHKIRPILHSRASQALRPFVAQLFSSSRADKLFDAQIGCDDLLDTYLLTRGIVSPAQVLKSYSDAELKNAHGYLRDCFSEEIIRSSIPASLKISYFDQVFYMKNQLLRDADWASMAHSLEVRCPFVDVELLKTTLSIAYSGQRLRKSHLRSALLDPISNEFKKRKKTGFVVPRSSGPFSLEEHKINMTKDVSRILDDF